MKTKTILVGLLIPIALFFTQGCGKVKFSSAFRADDKVGAQITPPPPILTPCEQNPESCGYKEPEDCKDCYMQIHRQKEETTKFLDLVFVTDTSSSLNAERTEVADGIKNFIAQLPPGVQYNIGVILAHGSLGTHSGKLYQTDNKEPVVLRSGELSLEMIQTYLKLKLTQTKPDYKSDGGEEGLYSLSKILAGSNLTTAKSQGMFRDHAGLAVIFISDENDICARYPPGVIPVLDKDYAEGPAFDRDCADVTHQSVYNQLKALKGDMPLSVNAIIYTGQNPIPVGNEDEIGYGYKEIVELANGVLVDIAAHNIANDLAIIGQSASNHLMVVSAFELEISGIDAESIWVEVDSTRIEHSYNSATNTVHIAAENAGGPGSRVVVHYCISKINDHN